MPGRAWDPEGPGRVPGRGRGFDADDLLEGELEELEEELVDEASAASTIAELEHEIATLADLEQLARQLRDSGSDREWEELSKLLRHAPEMFDANGNRRKLTIFSKHRDTLNCLAAKLRALLGRPESVGVIPVVRQAADSIGMLGACVLIGGAPAGAEFTLDHLSTLWGKRVISALGGSGRSGTLIGTRLAQARTLPLRPLVRRYDLPDIDKALGDASRGEVIKPVLRMSH